MIYLVNMFIICSEFSAESMQGYDTSLIYFNWIQVYQLAIDTILFYDIQVKRIVLLLLTYLCDFEVWFSYLLMHPLLLTSTFSINFLCTPSIFILCCSTFLLTHYKKLYDVSTVIPLKHIVKSSVKHHNH